jgi:hypothetical protein
MALNKVNITKGQGNLGRPLPGEDHISGMVLYTNATQKTIEKVLQPSDYTLGYDTELVEDFFRMNPKGVLYVGAFPTPTDYDYSEIKDLQNFAKGEIRQCLVKSTEELSSQVAGDVQSVATELEQNSRPLSIVLDCPVTSFTSTGDLPDLRGQGKKNVSVVASKDKNEIHTASGLLLGTISKAKVSENIAWVQEYNLQSGSSYSEIQMITGELLEDVTDNDLNDLKTKGYISIREFTDFSGKYFTDSDTLTDETSDFAFIEANRTIDKAIRQVRRRLLPQLNRPILVNDDGTLGEEFISFLKAEAGKSLDRMVIDEELSAFNIVINPEQQVLSDSTVDISIDLVPIGSARNINVVVGYTLNIDN